MWKLPPLSLTLSLADVHIWRVSLALPQKQLSAMANNLSSDEKTRANRFKFSKDQNAFVAARTILRDILARYLNTEPASLHFSYSQHGKPFLPDESLQFNLAHAHDMAVYIIAKQHVVGI